jgi:8-oxo-dGTP pyrophosphatase MutT (NUDIX family)
MKRYAQSIVFSPDFSHVMVLTKRHGPEFLIGRLNFPGGHIEEGESPEEAASRECKEEADITVSPDAWLLARYRRFGSTAELYTYCAVSADIFSARSMTDELIEVRMALPTIVDAWQFPELFCPDFMSLLASAIEALREAQRCAPAAPAAA